MCGILGHIGKRGFDADAFGRALDVMAAHGPNDRGIYAEPEVLLGHGRLVIIDLSAAMMPLPFLFSFVSWPQAAISDLSW